MEQMRPNQSRLGLERSHALFPVVLREEAIQIAEVGRGYSFKAPLTPSPRSSSEFNFVTIIVRIAGWPSGMSDRSFARQCSEKRQLRSLHRRLYASQRMAANQDFVHGKDQSEFLLLVLALEFGERKFVMGQRHGMICR